MAPPQTPKQRLANQRYAKREESKKGKPESAYTVKKKQPSPLNTGWLAVMAFLVLGGGAFELLRVFGIF